MKILTKEEKRNFFLVAKKEAVEKYGSEVVNLALKCPNFKVIGLKLLCQLIIETKFEKGYFYGNSRTHLNRLGLYYDRTFYIPEWFEIYNYIFSLGYNNPKKLKNNWRKI